MCAIFAPNMDKYLSINFLKSCTIFKIFPEVAESSDELFRHLADVEHQTERKYKAVDSKLIGCSVEKKSDLITKLTQQVIS